MPIVHPEPEFRIVLKQSEQQPSLAELKSLREADVNARDLRISELKEEITRAGVWTSEALEHFDARDYLKKLEGSTWQINIETVEL
ncbi:MAG: hypothetical protein OQK04_00110 [Kangiellaceae bacterium]|nr:hypothetical protein [Kangiellaceae bacterium]MCW8997102.1 hypothetical protein [Kangiellaceae bacterium]